MTFEQFYQTVTKQASVSASREYVRMLCVQADVRRSFIGAMWYYHKFFVKETPSFIAKKGQRWRVRKTWTTEIHEQYYPLTFRQKMKYPIAYLKFMVMMAKNYFAWKRGQNPQEDFLACDCDVNTVCDNCQKINHSNA